MRKTLQNEPPTDTVSDIEQTLTLLARTLESLQRKRHYPLERAHYILLWVILRHGPQTVSSLAAHLSLDNSTVTRQVAVMESSSLLERNHNPEDGRSQLLTVTHLGREKAESMRQARIDRIANLMTAWSEKDQNELVRLLGRLNEDLAK
ncbi:MAG TPA: MarR family transcriptional regulator [Desulfuromonadales bacterium]|nr:MarR family transcriptional regulator [Desulfuromonadales bacterium]